MKITRNQLRQLIQEELGRINESSDGPAYRPGEGRTWQPDDKSSMTVKRVFVKTGDKVKAGQRLAKIEDSNGQTQIIAWTPYRGPFGDRYMPTKGEITLVHIEPERTYNYGQAMFDIKVTERTGED